MSGGFGNTVKTTALFAGLWAIVMGIGALVAWGSGNSMFIWVFAGVGVIATAVSYWNSDKIAIRAMQAREVGPQEAPKLHAMVQELAERAGQPMPRLYVSPTQAPNAFATGRNPQNAAVCCTVGILELLDERELRGVLGHELMHVYNRDILTSSVAAAMAGVITSVAQFLLFFGGGGRQRTDGPLALIGMLAMALLAPMAATLIQLAISRTREFDADASGAELTGDPLALASALAKIESGAQARPLRPEGDMADVSHLMIANPFRAGAVSRLFATHPPMAERIERLREQARGNATQP